MSHRRRSNLDTFRMMTEVWPEPKPKPTVKRLATPDLIEELEWLLDNGAQPWEAAEALQRSQNSLSRLMYRKGRNDLGTRMLPERDWKKEAA